MNGLFIGLTSVDIIYSFSQYLEENSKNKSDDGLIDVGGPATNAAFAFAALGGNATLLSLIGDQPFGSFMKDRIASLGIEHVDLNSQWKGNPEIASIFVNASNGSRTIATRKPPSDISYSPPPISLTDYQVICVDGFYGSFVANLLQGNKNNIPVVFDGGSYKAYTSELLESVSHPILSERFSFPDSPNPMKHLQSLGKERIAITRGERPLTVWDKGSSLELPVPQVQAIDTLAAGDIFHGAFAWYLLETKGDFLASLKQASNIASLSCTVLGPRDWISFLPLDLR